MKLKWQERLFNWSFGLSLICWSVLGLDWQDLAGETSVRYAISLLNFTVGSFFLLRSPQQKAASQKQIIKCLPSFIACGLCFKWALPPQEWPFFAQVLFWAGTLWTILSFSFLGRSFAVLPAVRQIVIGGPYKWMRHPAYLGESVMAFCCFLTSPLTVAAPFAGFVLALCLRIRAEEACLHSSDDYGLYCSKVRYRLLPGLW